MDAESGGMRMILLVRRAFLAGVVAFGIAGCSTPTSEPPNLSRIKQQIRAYVESGRYIREVDAVAAEAKEWVIQRAARGGDRLTVIFDLDETLFDNWPHISAMDFGYVPREWERWVEEANAPAIESVREVYRTVRQLGLEVVYITGRPEDHRAGTERNLRAIGCHDFVLLVCKPPSERGTSAAFKTAVRRKLVADGRTIIANIGDQQSDLAGGFSERTFKLPNAFYLTE
jgi:predicted secreted acid phosphatase